MKPELSLILVVDDNENVRDLLTVRLEKRGYRVQTAVNGREALEVLRRESFDLVLLDIMMPEMNGYEVLEHLKGDAELRHVPVVVLSALNDINSVVKCIDLGAEDYLFKPINRSLLWSRMQASLEKKHLRDQEQAHLAALAVMQQIDQELNATLDIHHAAAITLHWAIDQTRATGGLVATVDDDTAVVEAAHQVSLAVGDALPAIADRLNVNAPEIRHEPLNPQAALTDGGAHRVDVPIIRERALHGIIILESRQPFDDQQLRFLDRLSDHASIALNNAQLYGAVQAADLAKSEFVAFVSHELRTPMTSINAYTDLIKRGVAGEVNSRQSEFLSIIGASIERMMALVSDLDDISRIETGQLNLTPEDVLLGAAIEEVLQALEQRIQAKRQQVSVNLDASLPPLAVDRMRLLQIMTNLLSNASKYTPDEGTITVCARRVADADMIEISVRDNGLGIAEEDQDRIFSQFFRAGDDEVRAIVGTGLGLHITKRLVELHAGEIWFESAYRDGTTFYLTLPAAVQTVPVAPPQP